MFKPRAHVFTPTYPQYKSQEIPDDFIKRVEKLQYFDIGEKIELLALSINRKMTAEIYLKIPFALENNLEKADEGFMRKLELEVSSLGLPYFRDSYTRFYKSSGYDREFAWFQISRNQLISDYIQKNQGRLSDPDWGVLYGFPMTAIQAFSGFIPNTRASESISSYFLAGVCSADFLTEESTYYENVWNEIMSLSPVIAKEAQQHYQEYLRTL